MFLMDEAQSLSPPKPPYRDSNTQTHHHHDAAKRGGAKPLDPPITVRPGQVVFRLLCHTSTAGGVIGSSGTIVRRLERDTGARISVLETIPNCHERVINVIGGAAIDRKITVGGDDYEGFGEDYEVSQAQEALIRVFQRVLEVEGTGVGVIGCRLLAGVGQIGAIMGRGGKIVDNIRKSTGAKIRVLPKDQLPQCASPDDELIQVMGGTVSVKKALVAIAQRLQDRPPMERLPADIPSYEVFPDPHTQSLPQHSSLSPPLPGSAVDYSPVGHPLSTEMDRILNLDEESTQQKVVFRLLCSTSTVGGVIGKGATIVKALEHETGASIKIAASVAWSKERVATISAMENPGKLYSPAQIAVIRVFARSMEIGIETGIVSSLGKGETVAARLLVASNQVGCLIGGGTVASDIITVSGVEIQLFEGDLVPNCAAENDSVVQIKGAYESVKGALFQVTSRLRDNLFSNTASDGAGARHYSYSAIPDINPYEREKTTSPGFDHFAGLSPFDQEMTLTQEMDRLGFPHKVGGHHSTSLQPLQTMERENITSVSGISGRMEPTVKTNRTVEVVVPEQAFGFVYGESGTNLARLKQISGATIIVEDPCHGKCDGKVIISGTVDQIQVARSLLQAFILPEM